MGDNVKDDDDDDDADFVDITDISPEIHELPHKHEHRSVPSNQLILVKPSRNLSNWSVWEDLEDEEDAKLECDHSQDVKMRTLLRWILMTLSLQWANSLASLMILI